MPSNNPLPPQEANLFKKVLKSYEQKQYKKGLQFVKDILKKFPDHGETLSMKGLILNYTNKKAEAYECAQRGLKHDVKSHVCWHVYGLLQRSDRKYDEAIKCYRNALKCDKDNLQILRDLSLLQIQIRDLEGYRDTRYQLFQLRPAQRASWIGYAMSYHLLGDYETAINILDEFAKTQQNKKYDYETSEFLLYHNMLLREAGLYQQAIDHLNSLEEFIVDKLAVVELKGESYLKMNSFEKAAGIYLDLIDRNPDNLLYYRQLEICKKLKTPQEKVEFYRSFQVKYPRSDLPRKLPLEFLEGSEFREAVDAYMQRALHKGVPPLFKELKGFYKNKEKLRIVEEVCLSYVDSLKTKCVLKDVNNNEKEPPSTLLWVYYYLSQHYDFLTDTENALKYINLAIEYTPTLVELYMIKAKIYKHAGNLYQAVKWLDEAQSLDTADRYINYKCSKYMLRADLIKESQDIAGKFTREGVAPFDYLREMQCMWFENECASAYKRMGKYGEALKKCHQVERHFQEIIEDQFDFHSYCMRKMTLKSYVDMLRLEDCVKNHPFFFKAARTAIEIYLRLHDKPLSNVEDDKIENADNLSASELRKLKNKQKKQQLKAQAEKEKQTQLEQKKKEISKQKTKDDGEAETINEDDLHPDKLERPENPLEECSKFLKPLEEFAKKHIESHILAFEVYSRKDRFLLMLRSLKRMKAIVEREQENFEYKSKFHYYLCNLINKYNKSKTTLDETITKVIDLELQQLYNGKSIDELNEDFLKENSNKLVSLVEASKVLYLLNPAANQKRAISLVTSLDDTLVGRELRVSSEIHSLLTSGVHFGKVDEKQIEEYKLKCHTLWPHSNQFHSKDELTADIQSCIEQLDSTSSLSKLISNKPEAAAATGGDISTLASKLESLKLENDASKAN